ncbi:MAG: multicopper oxidase domain-containing protein [Nitrospiraceae bacterium]|nr:multicopper oxidase domain-containing protein [Nitrospiraceae bacterium]OQW37387.1 MAG: hypothetical protein A4E20_05230 [Nitrospira sp. SG-bin2]
MRYLRENMMRTWFPAQYFLVALTLASCSPSAAPPSGTPPNAMAPTPLPASQIPQFVDPLPLLAVAGGTIETITAPSATLSMCEFKATVMPSTFAPTSSTYSGTYVWGYRNGSTCPGSGTPLSTYIGPVLVSTRGTPTEIQYINSLPNTAASRLSAWKTSTDQTLSWADPLNSEANRCAGAVVENQPPYGGCASNYAGPVPTIPHLHGGEVPPVLDGGPDAWFTSDGTYRGHSYYSKAGTVPNGAIYRYPNKQEAAPLWFHDHALGVTRLNVYAGLAGIYLITDPALTLPAGLHPIGLRQGAGGSIDHVTPLVIQDRMFDTTGQLYFPNMGPNPEHPFWMMEFFGDTNVVNGKVWPYLNVEARRYRFLLINGSNARTYELSLSGQPLWQIATDGGYLDKPVRLGKLTVMPGERADIMIDFSGLAGQTLILENHGRTPFPNGAPPDAATAGRILQFRVGPSTLAGADASYNLAQGDALRPPMRRLVNPATGMLTVAPSKTRQLTLNDMMGSGGMGMVRLLINNTKASGTRADGTARTDFTAVTVGGVTEYMSEASAEGETEVWEIVNLTADAHPIHIHLTPVQVLNRQRIDLGMYKMAYDMAFPSGASMFGDGPPLTYLPSAASGSKHGGNPDIQPYLDGPIQLPEINEAGWKDTVIAYPGQVTRIAVRFAPTDTAAGVARNYSFDPDAGGHGFVWHCHILDHEDNDMMRPYKITAARGAARTYVMGVDY